MEAKKAKVNREFKDGMFRTLFNDKEKMLELYNAVSEKQMGEEALENIPSLNSLFTLAFFASIRLSSNFIFFRKQKTHNKKSGNVRN